MLGSESQRGPERPMRERPSAAKVEIPKVEVANEVIGRVETPAPELKISLESIGDLILPNAEANKVEIIPSPKSAPELAINRGGPVEAPTGADLASDQVEDTDEFKDVGYKPSFFNRLTKKPWARAAMRLVGLAGAAEGMRQGTEAYQETERQSEVQQEIVSVAYESTFDLESHSEIKFTHQIDADSIRITSGDVQVTGAEVLVSINEAYSDWARENWAGVTGIVDQGIAQTELSDGSYGVDVLLLEMAYGDQLKSYKMNVPERVELLLQATGLNQEEFDAIGRIYRNSVIERPDASASGIKGLQFHDSDHFNSNDAPAERAAAVTHKERLQDALKITTEIVRSLDVAEMSDGDRSELTRVVSDAIKMTVEADNAWTQAVGYTNNWDDSSHREGFTQTVENKLDQVQGEAPMLERLLDSDQAVDLAWRKVAAMEDDEAGPVHTIAKVITGTLDAKGEAFFQKAVELDPNSEAFKTGLAHFSEGSDVLVATH